MKTDKSSYTLPLSIILAGAVIGAGILAKDMSGNWSNVKSLVMSKKPSPAEVIDTAPKPQGNPIVGEPGSGHVHANMVMYINGNSVDLEQDKYMMKSEAVHLENKSGLTVHTHATGITIPYFLSTLGMEMTKNCLALDTGERFCNDSDKKLSMMVNGTEISAFSSYEIKQGDQILVNYGSEGENNILLKFNNIPPVPKELL